MTAAKDSAIALAEELERYSSAIAPDFWEVRDLELPSIALSQNHQGFINIPNLDRSQGSQDRSNQRDFIIREDDHE